MRTFTYRYCQQARTWKLRWWGGAIFHMLTAASVMYAAQTVKNKVVIWEFKSIVAGVHLGIRDQTACSAPTKLLEIGAVTTRGTQK